MYKQGQIVEYIDAGKSKKGMIIANNKCLQHSKVFQIVPFRFGIFPAPSERDLINENCIKFVIEKHSNYELDAILKEKGKKPHPLFNFGDVVFADLPTKGEHIQSGRRPVIVTSTPNKKGFCRIVPLSTKLKKQSQPTHFILKKGEGGLKKESVVLGEAEMMANIKMFEFKIGQLSETSKASVQKAIDAQYSVDIA